MIDIRLRSKAPQAEIEGKLGKIGLESDSHVRLTGATKVRKPDGKPLCVYLPGAMKAVATQEVYEILDSLRPLRTNNRGLAGGGPSIQSPGKRKYGVPVSSAIIGSVDPTGVYKYCRLTAWTGAHLPEWQKLQPYLKAVAAQLQEHVPDRYENQLIEAMRTSPEWIVPGTPFSTITVNNTYPTGYHYDKGDLDAGFSTIACIRRGEFTGGHLTFPEYKVSVDLQDGDLILMDAHEMHGNTAITCACGNVVRKPCEVCGAKRISTVSYFRTRVAECGTYEEELERAVIKREKRATD